MDQWRDARVRTLSEDGPLYFCLAPAKPAPKLRPSGIETEREEVCGGRGGHPRPPSLVERERDREGGSWRSIVASKAWATARVRRGSQAWHGSLQAPSRAGPCQDEEKGGSCLGRACGGLHGLLAQSPLAHLCQAGAVARCNDLRSLGCQVSTPTSLALPTEVAAGRQGDSQQTFFDHRDPLLMPCGLRTFCQIPNG